MGIVQFDRCIVIHGYAKDNGLLTWKVPNLNAISTTSFQTKMVKSSHRPIFKLKTDSVRIKINLLFTARWLFKGSKSFQKIAPENDFHT